MYLLSIVILIVFVVIALVLQPIIKQEQNKYIGRVGEETTASIVESISPNIKVFQNLYVPTVKGNTTEIDTACVTSRGIIVFETKNYSGTIYGNTKDKTWRAEVYNKTNEFYNPVLQNETHIKYLKRAIKFNVPIYSFIVLSDRCTIGDIDTSWSDVKVVKMSDLRTQVVSLINHNDATVPEFVFDSICKDLEKMANPSDEVIRKHREYIQSKYG